MSQFDQKNRRKFEGSHLIGTLLMLAGIIVGIVSSIIDFNPPFNNMIPLVICMLAIGLIMLFTYSGVEINFAKNGFREYFSFCGIKFGEWNSLPKISKIKVKTDHQLVANMANGISPTLSGKIKEHRVILYANEPTPLLSFMYDSREASMKSAELLAVNLQTKVEIE